jgi:hypothetical protein
LVETVAVIMTIVQTIKRTEKWRESLSISQIANWTELVDCRLYTCRFVVYWKRGISGHLRYNPALNILQSELLLGQVGLMEKPGGQISWPHIYVINHHVSFVALIIRMEHDIHWKILVQSSADQDGKRISAVSGDT